MNLFRLAAVALGVVVLSLDASTANRTSSQSSRATPTQAAKRQPPPQARASKSQAAPGTKINKTTGAHLGSAARQALLQRKQQNGAKLAPKKSVLPGAKTTKPRR